MSKTAAPQKIGGIAVAVCLIFVLSMSAAVAYRYNEVRSAVVAQSNQKTKLDKLQKRVEESKDSIQQFKTEQEEFQKMLFDERDVPAFLDGISDSAAQTQVYVQEMRTQQFGRLVVPKDFEESSRKMARVRITEDLDAKERQNPKKKLNDMLTVAAMPVQFKVRGTFEALVRFLNSIENYKQLVTVSNVSIGGKPQDYPQLSCEFTLRIYSLKKLGDIKS